MNDVEFRNKLKEALEAIDKRLCQMEHLVNDVIIGSLESAATEYKDAEDYDAFRGNYGERLDALDPSYKKLFGDDYDLSRSIYDDLKGMDGYGTDSFDEASVMEERLADLEARIAAIKEDIAEAKEEETSEKANDSEKEPEAEVEVEEEISDEQLAKELADAMAEGASL